MTVRGRDSGLVRPAATAAPAGRAGAAAAQPPAHRGRRTIARSAVVVLVAAIGGVAWWGAAGGFAPALPAPPPTPRQPAAVTAHVQQAYARARQDRNAAAVVGAYCLALHADMFYAVAERCYERVTALSDDWEWVYLRALIRADLGGGPDLLRHLRTVVERAPAFGPAWLRLGEAEFKTGRVDEAERAWTTAAALPDPPRPASASSVPEHHVEVPLATHASLGLARIRLARGDVEGAAAIVEQQLAGAPPFSSMWRLAAEIETARERPARAERALARARRLPPYAPYTDPMVDRLALESRNSTFLLRLASEANLSLNGGWSEYLTRRALEFDPGNPEVILKLGRVLRTRGKNEEALEYFRRYEAMVPGDAAILAHLGGVLSEMGRFAEAEPLLRRAAASLDDAISHYNLALLLARTNRLDEAVTEYEEALARDAADVRARSNLAATLVRKGDLRRAAEELRRVLELDPEDAVAQVNIGLVHVQQGDIPRARRAFEEALRLEPSLTPAREALASLAGP